MKHVTIYSTPTCPYCQMVKAHLKEKGIEFTNYNVADDEEKANEMIEKTGQMAVPVIVIQEDDEKEKIIVGFDKEEIDKDLNIK